MTWYGWDGDRLTTIQNDRTRIQTIYQPGSFTPLIRVETATGELAKTQRRSLADTLQQSGGEDGGSVVFPPVLVQMLDRLESEILADRVSEESRRLAGIVRPDGGADAKPDGPGVHAGAKNPPVPLRPSRPAAGACQHGRGNRMVRRIVMNGATC
ncbi:rhsC in rhs element domain protein [Escherichia coli DEC10E]|nr:rhsC in rhs element domain protein [Escherichia coli DEC10E]